MVAKSNFPKKCSSRACAQHRSCDTLYTPCGVNLPNSGCPEFGGADQINYTPRTWSSGQTKSIIRPELGVRGGRRCQPCRRGAGDLQKPKYPPLSEAGMQRGVGRRGHRAEARRRRRDVRSCFRAHTRPSVPSVVRPLRSASTCRVQGGFFANVRREKCMDAWCMLPASYRQSVRGSAAAERLASKRTTHLRHRNAVCSVCHGVCKPNRLMPPHRHTCTSFALALALAASLARRALSCTLS